MNEPRAARTSHSHLFPGAEVMLEAADVQTLEPCGLLLRFSDDVEVPAEILLPDDTPSQKPVLVVDAHTTAAGTTVPAKSWLVKGITPGGPWLMLKIGARIPHF